MVLKSRGWSSLSPCPSIIIRPAAPPKRRPHFRPVSICRLTLAFLSSLCNASTGTATTVAKDVTGATSGGKNIQPGTSTTTGGQSSSGSGSSGGGQTGPSAAQIAALKAVNGATDVAAMQAAIEANAATLGLETGTNSSYNSLIAGRKTSVSVDLLGNKPTTDGYTIAGLKSVFDEIVATRVVFQASVDKVNNATTVEDLDGVSYVQMLIDNLNTVKKYKTHSGIEINPTLINTLTDLVTRYNGLTADKQTKVLQTLIGKNFASSTLTRDALDSALKAQEGRCKA